MQSFDSRDELGGKRHGGLKDHPSPGIRCAGRATVEVEPRGGVDKCPVTVDEARNPKRVLAQIDPDFTPLARAQEMAVNSGGGYVDHNGRVALTALVEN